MSMSINDAMNPQMFRLSEPGGKNVPPAQEKVNDIFQDAGKQALKMQKMQHHSAGAAPESGPEKLQAMADRLENRIEAVNVHYDKMRARLNERFDKMETRALEAGKEGRAEHIGEISDRVNSRLDDALEKTVARLDARLERIRAMLSESYEGISENTATSAEQGISEVA